MTTVTNQQTVFHADIYDGQKQPPASAPHIPPKNSNTFLPVMLVCLGYGLFNIGDACIKALAAKFHFSQIMTFHCIVIISFICAYGFIREGRAAFVIRKKKLVSIRAALSVVVGVLNVYSFPHIELTTFYTLVFTSPFWVTILSALFLGEKLDRRQVGIILAGFAVILFIFQPGSQALTIYAVFTLIGAFLYAASMVVMRKMGPQESRTMIITSGSVFTIAAVAPFLPAHFIMPDMKDILTFIGLGASSAVGLTAVAYAFQNAPSAQTVAPFHYTQIFWGTILGYFVFAEVPAMRTMIGAAFIIVAGLYLIYGEARAGKKRRAAEETARADIDQAQPV